MDFNGYVKKIIVLVLTLSATCHINFFLHQDNDKANTMVITVPRNLTRSCALCTSMTQQYTNYTNHAYTQEQHILSVFLFL